MLNVHVAIFKLRDFYNRAIYIEKEREREREREGGRMK